MITVIFLPLRKLKIHSHIILILYNKENSRSDPFSSPLTHLSGRYKESSSLKLRAASDGLVRTPNREGCPRLLHLISSSLLIPECNYETDMPSFVVVFSSFARKGCMGYGGLCVRKLRQRSGKEGIRNIEFHISPFHSLRSASQFDKQYNIYSFIWLIFVSLLMHYSLVFLRLILFHLFFHSPFLLAFLLPLSHLPTPVFLSFQRPLTLQRSWRNFISSSKFHIANLLCSKFLFFFSITLFFPIRVICERACMCVWASSRSIWKNEEKIKKESEESGST